MNRSRWFSLALSVTIVMMLTQTGLAQQTVLEKKDGSVRFATFNTAMNRKNANDLKQELESGDSPKTQKIAEIIQRVRPDVLLINELDHDAFGDSIQAFRKKFLRVSQNGQEPIRYDHVYFSEVNTGVDSGIDLNMDGRQQLPRDGFGFGYFPGQYAMVVLSRYPIDVPEARKFQKFLWKDMPEAAWPKDPDTGEHYYNDQVREVFRLSSKNHWDLPIKIDDRTIHFLVSHPTPPVFDGAEDANGSRNHDEIRLWSDYIGGKADYLYDDDGNKGGLPEGADFIIAGDLNADPHDGASRNNAVRLLTDNPLINDTQPRSEGGTHYSKEQGQANLNHKGDSAMDTGDFGDKDVGNMRIDYCLPSKTLEETGSGVFWPKPDQPGGDLVEASDHRLVWVDVKK